MKEILMLQHTVIVYTFFLICGSSLENNLFCFNMTMALCTKHEGMVLVFLCDFTGCFLERTMSLIILYQMLRSISMQMIQLSIAHPLQ